MFNSIWRINRTRSCVTTPGQSGPWSNGNEEILCIPQSSCISGISPSNCFVLYPGHSLGESYPSAEMQSVYSTAPTDWTKEKVSSFNLSKNIYAAWKIVKTVTIIRSYVGYHKKCFDFDRNDEIIALKRCPWCSRYRRMKWTRRHELKSWTRLIAFHIALIPLGKVWIQLFSLQLWVNSRTD